MFRERYFHVVPDDVLSQLIEVKGRSLWEFTRNVKWFLTKNLKIQIETLIEMIGKSFSAIIE